MSQTNRPEFVVHVPAPECWGGIGPFVVRARTIDDAFRIVRGRFGGMLSNHVRREYRPLVCQGQFSFQPDRLLPCH